MKANAQLETQGFAGQMHGASLPDLIQMQCLSMVTRAVRVDANSVTGHIYFAGGQVIHACVGVLVGEAALFEMLCWKNGTFTFEEGLRAPDETVTRHWQGILLEAAQLEDEEARERSPDDPPHYPAILAVNRFMTKHPIEELRSDPDVISFVQSDSEGNLLESKGDEAESLQAGFAYAMQLLQLVGASLGAEGLQEVHCQGKEMKALGLVRNDSAAIVLTTPRANLGTMAKALLK
jgi:hypothetical protein